MAKKKAEITRKCRLQPAGFQMHSQAGVSSEPRDTGVQITGGSFRHRPSSPGLQAPQEKPQLLPEGGLKLVRSHRA